MPFFEVITKCPIHKKNVYIRVEAADSLKAKEKVLGMVIDCPLGTINLRAHSFVVGFREGMKEIEDVIPLPWMPPSITSVAPSLVPIKPVPPTPLETRYYIKADVQKRQIKKARWWSK